LPAPLAICPFPTNRVSLDWIKAGHAFIAIHAGSDTFHGWPGYIDMLGGEFKRHGAQVSVDCINADPSNPATASLPKVWTIQQEEIYQFKNYDPSKVHDLLYMEKTSRRRFSRPFSSFLVQRLRRGKGFLHLARPS